MKGFENVPDVVLEDDGGAHLGEELRAELERLNWESRIKSVFRRLRSGRIQSATQGLTDFLIQRGALRHSTHVGASFTGTWIERETPRPGRKQCVVDLPLLERIVEVYQGIAEPEHLADRLTQIALRLDEVHRGDLVDVFLEDLLTLVHKGDVNPEPRAPDKASFQLAFHIREAVSVVRKVLGNETGRAFARGLKSNVAAHIRRLLLARPSKTDRLQRTAEVRAILKKHSNLRSGDLDHIAILVGQYFGDERPTTSEDSSVNRLKKRRERRRKRP